ncbi:hypothetical protein E2C01_009808 [Portunus trituberculatus]|uniref:Uncharacterized protein n=1 Tax=Portunus trituberculatus TaxID=210409 RepID=A0A5B7D6S0_PORTR|nr:hypothetical protein [Portunus trituberculatus]
MESDSPSRNPTRAPSKTPIVLGRRSHWTSTELPRLSVAVDRVKPAYLLQDVTDKAAATTMSAVCTATTQLGLRRKKRVSFLLPQICKRALISAPPLLSFERTSKSRAEERERQ